MAVKVIARGDSSGDYEFVVKAIRMNRCCFDEQIVELLDSENNLLYTVPYSSLVLIQYIQDEENVNLQEFVDGEYVTQVCFDNNLSDATIECTRVNANKVLNETMIEAHQFLGADQKTQQEIWFQEFALPISKVKFINHNFIINPKENPEPVVEPTETEETDVVLPTNPEGTTETESPKKRRSKFAKRK